MTKRTRSNIRLTNEAWEAFLTAHTTLMRVYSSEDMWRDVSMREYDVLYTLAKAKRPLRPRELQTGVLLSQPALSRMVDRLVTRELVQRTSDPRDGRAIYVELTDEGRRVQHEVGSAHARSIDRKLGEALSEAQLRTLEHLCEKLNSSASRDLPLQMQQWRPAS